jgi:hypothetical protein
MKGFLNKVQTKVTGGKPNADGKPIASAVEGVAGAAAVARSEVTPRADISLPKRHDRRYAPRFSLICIIIESPC